MLIKSSREALMTVLHGRHSASLDRETLDPTNAHIYFVAGICDITYKDVSVGRDTLRK